jgi:hypothetical protein
MSLGPHPAAHTTNHGDRGLHLELPLAVDDLGGGDLEPVQAEQDRP